MAKAKVKQKPVKKAVRAALQASKAKIAAAAPKPPTAAAPKCANCQQPSTEDYFCHGCKLHICDACETDPCNVPWGPHTIDDHHLDGNRYRAG